MNMINKLQTKEQRKNKYLFLIECGIKRNVAAKLRDWSHRHIVEYLHANKEKIMTKYKKKDETTKQGTIKS